MSKRLVHTPEGVRDIYGAEYEKKMQIQERLHQTFLKSGYKDIQTPSFEFFDVFGKEIGTTASRDLYKFFDKEGNTLALRPDFTPSMARCAAKYFMEETLPVRFTYQGNAFVNTSNLQGKLKETTQMGVELFNEASVLADAEMIALAVEALKSAGLKEFQISIGNIEFIKGICEEIGLSDEDELNLREFISTKNYFGMEEFLQSVGVKKEQTDVILKMTDAFGGEELLDEAKTLVSNHRSLGAIERLRDLYEALKVYGVTRYVSFDLSMVSKYHYYTGVIFKGYTYGVGDAILTGGRYDTLLSYFGKEAPAIGFMITIDELMIALASQKIPVENEPDLILMLYKPSASRAAVQTAVTMRGEGKKVELMCMHPDCPLNVYEAYAKNNQIKEIDTRYIDNE